MASGWAPDGAVQEQIDTSVKDAIKLARSKLAKGEGLTHCEECGVAIPAARRAAIPAVRFCIDCQSVVDEQEEVFTGINRRGSKDSQLR